MRQIANKDLNDLLQIRYLLCINVLRIFCFAFVSHRRASFFACCLDKHLYVIGGRNETGYLSSVEAYNLETNEWSYVSSLPQPLAAHAGAVHNGKIYISGQLTELGYSVL